jgi:hypothetical protein
VTWDHLLVAELVARGLKGFIKNGIETLRITQQLRLPASEPSWFEPYAWPREYRFDKF